MSEELLPVFFFFADRFSVGQNLASMRATEELKRDWSGMVTAWYDEVKMFNPKHIQPFK